MMAQILDFITETDDLQLIQKLQEFTITNSNSKEFKDLKSFDRKNLYDFLISKASQQQTSLSQQTNSQPTTQHSPSIQQQSPSIQSLCLQVVRILSRDKRDLCTSLSSTSLDHLLHLANLTTPPSITPHSFPVLVEALKCLCNLVFNSDNVLKYCSSSDVLYAIVQRIKSYNKVSICHGVKLYDIKLLHLITALDPQSRSLLRYEHQGLPCLIHVLDFKHGCGGCDDEDGGVGGNGDEDGGGCGEGGGEEGGDKEIHLKNKELHIESIICKNLKNGVKDDGVKDDGVKGKRGELVGGMKVGKLTDDEVELAGEVLKVIFNIAIINNQCCEYEEVHFEELVAILRNLLTTPLHSINKLHILHGHVVNLLIFLSDFSYQQLLTPATAMKPRKTLGDSNTAVTLETSNEFMDCNMTAVKALLAFLNNKLEAKPPNHSTKSDLTPILQCMSRICKCNRIIRKYCRLQVLPYLGKEVHKLPEEGDLVRNKLCRLLTHTVMEIKSLAADFLFILCKENPERFIKYTGYGNAAGLLADKGMLAGGGGSGGCGSGGCGRSSCGSGGCGKSGCGGSEENGYSSQSDDSETEEYSDLKNNINPVTGRVELEKTSDMLSQMSQAEKEQMANELLNQMDRLERGGFIKPMRLNLQTGKPETVESVAEMVDKTNVTSNSSSDSE